VRLRRGDDKQTQLLVLQLAASPLLHIPEDVEHDLMILRGIERGEIEVM
jgi:hypothetical protein